MTQLFIDGKEVRLAEDFKIDYIIENPFFTRNGEYTYNIDIDLNDVGNRIIYQNLGRADSQYKPKGRQAAIICDGSTIVQGTEIILSCDNNIAKIQIVSGNSELNYIAKGDLLMRELDLGTFVVNQETAKKSLVGFYPENKFVCTPIAHDKTVNDKTRIFNNLYIKGADCEYEPETTLIAQPYVLYIVDKLMEVLGYTVIKNELAGDDRWSKLILVNGINTNKLAEMLPDWTVDDFLDEVEKFFNCIFNINQLNKTVEIIRLNNFYDEKDIVYINDVFDESTTKRYDTKSPLAVTYDNVSYDFPSFNAYKYMKMDKKVKDSLPKEKRIHYYDNWDKLEQTIQDKVILDCTDYNFQAVGHKYERKGDFGLDIIDRFDDKTDVLSDNVTEMKIIPAEVVCAIKMQVLGDVEWHEYFMAYARNIDPLNEEDKDKDVHYIIQNGIEKSNGPDRLYVALYVGIQNTFDMNKDNPSLRNEGASLPMTLNDNIGYAVGSFGEKVGGTFFSYLVIYPDPTKTLRITGENGLYNTYYKYNIKVNTSTEYRFQFIADKIPDQRLIFVIRNKKYYCKSLSTKIYPEGRDSIIDGIFYPMD